MMLVAKVPLFLSAFTDGKQEVPNWEEVLVSDVRRPRSPFGDVQFGKGSSACMSLMCKCSFKTLALQNSCFLDVWINVLIKM